MSYDDKQSTFLTLRYQIALMTLTIITVIWGVLGAIISQTIEKEPFIPYILVVLGVISTIICLSLWRYFTHIVYRESAGLEISDIIYQLELPGHSDQTKRLEKLKEDTRMQKKIGTDPLWDTYNDKFDQKKQIDVFSRLKSNISEEGVRHFDILTILTIIVLIGIGASFIILGEIYGLSLYPKIFPSVSPGLLLLNDTTTIILLIVLGFFGVLGIISIFLLLNSPCKGKIKQAIIDARDDP